MIDDSREPATKGEVRNLRDELLIMIRGLDRRLDGHDGRFDGIDGNLRRLNATVVNLDVSMAELKGTAGKLANDFSKFSDILERMSANSESWLQKTPSQGSMLMEHEARIAKLESRPN